MGTIMAGLSKKLQRPKGEGGFGLMGYFGFLVSEVRDTLVQEGPVADLWTDDLTCALVLVQTADQVAHWAEVASGSFAGDQVLWFGYPKKSSKKYTCEVDRDHGWRALQEKGFEPVRQVALDDDWSALRFRRKVYIKKFTRKPEIWESSN